jgi:hypothetical protein
MRGALKATCQLKRGRLVLEHLTSVNQYPKGGASNGY